MSTVNIRQAEHGNFVIAASLALIITFLMTPLVQAQESSSCTGSLVLAILNQSGLLVAADKRLTNGQGTFDDHVKIHKVDRFTAVASTGTPMYGIHRKSGWNFEFDASNVVAGALTNIPTSGSLKSYSPILTQRLKQKFLAFVKNQKKGSPFYSGHPLFISRIFHYNQQNKTFEILSMQLDYDLNHPEDCSIGLLEDSDSIKNSFCYPLGNAELMAELIKGTNYLVSTLRDEPDVDRFLIKPTNPDRVRLGEAKKAALHLIALTSQYNDLAGQNNHSISNTADLCIIKPDSGFHWITVGSP